MVGPTGPIEVGEEEDPFPEKETTQDVWRERKVVPIRVGGDIRVLWVLYRSVYQQSIQTETMTWFVELQLLESSK